MIEICVFESTGSFASNKDKAKAMRTEIICPTLEKGQDLVIDFSGVDDATQSFVHALLSEAFRQQGIESMDRIAFRGCNDRVKKIVEIVCNYMQESLS